MENTPYCYFEIGDTATIWFEVSNKYLMVNKMVGRKLMNSLKENHKLEVINELIETSNHKTENTINNQSPNATKIVELDSNFYSVKKYCIGKLVIEVSYSSESHQDLIHPKFAHLEISSLEDANCHFKVTQNDNRIHLTVDGEIVGKWNWDQKHFFQGKFSMELIQKLYDKSEEDWIAVLHASAIYNNGKCLLFLGDSGNGKSTAISLLMAHRYTCIADDFVPLASDQNIYTFPSAISIKEPSLSILDRFYPSLKTEKNYHFKNSGKNVKYLKPTQLDLQRTYSCTELIFIKYESNANFSFKPINSAEGLSRLIPDSWISNLPENVSAFFDWFSKCSSFEMKYSNNSEMINCIDKLCENEN